MVLDPIDFLMAKSISLEIGYSVAIIKSSDNDNLAMVNIEGTKNLVGACIQNNIQNYNKFDKI